MGSAFSNALSTVEQSNLSTTLQNLLMGVEPGGRITLTTATPVMTSDVSNATSIYYTPYKHNLVPLYDGTTWALYEFTELTNSMSDSTKNPAASAASKNYDMFVWNDSGTLRLGRGPAWTSDTARGTGAGTTELERVDGRWVNKIAITNGAGAQKGLYVGTVRTDASAGQVDWEIGGSAAGGDPGFLYVWNAYNRVEVCLQVKDSTASWTYATATVREANNSTSNRVSFVCGLSGEGVQASYCNFPSNAGGVNSQVGVGVDSTSAFSGTFAYSASATSSENEMTGSYAGHPGLGLHFIQALERASGATATMYGLNAGIFATGMTFSGMF